MPDAGLAIDALPLVTVPVQDSRTRFPVHRIYCVGRNYADHAVEMGHSGKEAPFFFLKPADAALPVAQGSIGSMRYPSLTSDLHFEVELVVAIGQGGADIPVADALGHVWGYAVGLDMTRRDLQSEAKRLGRPWCAAKGFDQSAPLGSIRRAQGTVLPNEAWIALDVNGTTRQRARVGDMIWSVAEVIAHLSRHWALEPGDLLFTGTPAGVGTVNRGDCLTAQLDGLAALELRIE